MPTLNERLKKLRKQLNLSQKDFAEKVGISQRAASWSEQPGNNVSDSTIKAVCLVYGVNESWLRTGDGSMFAETASSAIDSLQLEFKLSPLERQILETYLSLGEFQREVILDYLRKLVKNLNLVADSDDQKNSIDIDSEVESYRAELEEQQKKGDGSSASDGSGAKMA